MMDEDSFKTEYTALIERIKSVSPDTKIICNSIYPVEAMYEAKDNGINNTVISKAPTASSFPITATVTAFI